MITFVIILVLAWTTIIGICDYADHKEWRKYKELEIRKKQIEIEQRRVATNQAKTMLECEKYNQASRK